PGRAACLARPSDPPLDGGEEAPAALKGSFLSPGQGERWTRSGRSGGAWAARKMLTLAPRTRGQPPMTGMTYDPEADAVYIYLDRAKVAETREDGPFIYDVDESGRIIGIEILAASKVLAPGEWRKARLPGTPAADAAE